MGRIFEKPNLGNRWTCPICNTNEEKPVILVPIPGRQEGNICEAKQVHLDCAKIVAINYVRAREGDDGQD